MIELRRRIDLRRVFATMAAASASSVRLPDAYAFLKRHYTKSQTAIVMYHRVCPEGDRWSDIGTDRVSPAIFELQLKYFRDNYQMVSLSELARYLLEGKSPREKTIAITFDDGYADNYLYAYPIMRRYSVPATVFLATGHIGTGTLLWTDKVRYAVRYARSRSLNLEELGTYYLASDRTRIGNVIKDQLKNLPDERKNHLIEKLVDASKVDIPSEVGHQLLLSWDRVVEMSRNGIDFGAHSVTHPILTKMPLEKARAEIVQSRKDIEGKLGKRVDFFAYPDGNFSTQIAKIVAESGFVGGLAVGNRWIAPCNGMYWLWRVVATEDMNKFMVLLSGLWGDFERLIKG